MAIMDPLFEGKLVYLSPLDHEKDPQVESRWTQDAGYLRLIQDEPALPLSPAQVKKRYEKIAKQAEEEKKLFLLRNPQTRLPALLRPQQPDAEADRLLGFAQLYWIGWTTGDCVLRMGIGAAADRRQGYGSDALSLIVRFVFTELNLHRITAPVPEYNPAARAFFEKFGFRQEVCRRQVLQRDGRYWDAVHLGLLQQDWQAAGREA